MVTIASSGSDAIGGQRFGTPCVLPPDQHGVDNLPRRWSQALCTRLTLPAQLGRAGHLAAATRTDWSEGAGVGRLEAAPHPHVPLSPRLPAVGGLQPDRMKSSAETISRPCAH